MLFDYYTRVKMEPSNIWLAMMYSIVEFKMRVLEESLKCYHQRGEFCHSSITGFKNTTINNFGFVQKSQSFVCVGRALE